MQLNIQLSSYQFTPINLGDSINTVSSEYYPSITINDSLFVFTRRGAGIREDFVESSLLPNHEYCHAHTINGSINEEPSKGAINISQDGEWLIFAGNFPSKGFGEFRSLYFLSTPQGWSEPINLGPQINTEFWESSPSLKFRIKKLCTSAAIALAVMAVKTFMSAIECRMANGVRQKTWGRW